MKISLAGKHHFPASDGGPSGGRVFDWLAKGLAALGHDVFYIPGQGASIPAPVGVRLVDEPCWEVDLFHCHSFIALCREVEQRGKPWVATCHTDLETWNMSRDAARDNWIFVSQSLARSYGRNRFVLNGIDPDELIYSETKEDYLLFVCGLQLAERKGLELAIKLARQRGLQLIVAGSSPNEQLVARVVELCNVPGIRYIGEISGRQKAEWFAGAKALLFPTQLNEAFGLVMAEALMSGTPVICSGFGACPELITPEVGFVCHDESGYLDAIDRVTEISPQQCRAVAMDRFHFMRMARDYVAEYEQVLSG